MPNPDSAWQNLQAAVRDKRLRKKAKSRRRPRRIWTPILEGDEGALSDSDQDDISRWRVQTASCVFRDAAFFAGESTRSQGLACAAGRSVSMGDLPLIDEGLEQQMDAGRERFVRRSTECEQRVGVLIGRVAEEAARLPPPECSMNDMVSEHWAADSDSDCDSGECDLQSESWSDLPVIVDKTDSALGGVEVSMFEPCPEPEVTEIVEKTDSGPMKVEESFMSSLMTFEENTDGEPMQFEDVKPSRSQQIDQRFVDMLSADGSVLGYGALLE